MHFLYRPTHLQFALAQNASIQAARKRINAAAMRVPQAASLKDPQISATGYPFYPYVPQTATGRVTAELMTSQEVPWKGKLLAQSQAAAAELDMARAQLAAVELHRLITSGRAFRREVRHQTCSVVVSGDRRTSFTVAMAMLGVLVACSRIFKLFDFREGRGWVGLSLTHAALTAEEYRLTAYCQLDRSAHPT